MAKGPGKYFRKGMSLPELTKMFPDDKTAEKWFKEARWPNGIRCAHCDSDDVQEEAKHPTMPHHCRSCRKYFSVKTGTAMQSSKLGYQTWAFGIYLFRQTDSPREWPTPKGEPFPTEHPGPPVTGWRRTMCEETWRRAFYLEPVLQSGWESLLAWVYWVMYHRKCMSNALPRRTLP